MPAKETATTTTKTMDNNATEVMTKLPSYRPVRNWTMSKVIEAAMRCHPRRIIMIHQEMNTSILII
jgi:hypothetical protein